MDNFGYAYFPSNNTYLVVQNGGGTLHAINVTAAGSADSTVTVYDNTAASGTIICVIDGSFRSSYIFDCAYEKGITIVTAGTTPCKATATFD